MVPRNEKACRCSNEVPLTNPSLRNRSGACFDDLKQTKLTRQFTKSTKKGLFVEENYAFVLLGVFVVVGVVARERAFRRVLVWAYQRFIAHAKFPRFCPKINLFATASRK